MSATADERVNNCVFAINSYLEPCGIFVAYARERRAFSGD